MLPLIVKMDPGIQNLKDRAKELLKQRDAQEAEAIQITERLNAPGQPGLSGGLIDNEVCALFSEAQRWLRTEWHRCCVSLVLIGVPEGRH